MSYPGYNDGRPEAFEVERPAAVAAIMEAITESLIEDDCQRALVQMRHLRGELANVLDAGWTELDNQEQESSEAHEALIDSMLEDCGLESTPANREAASRRITESWYAADCPPTERMDV